MPISNDPKIQVDCNLFCEYEKSGGDPGWLQKDPGNCPYNILI